MSSRALDANLTYKLRKKYDSSIAFEFVSSL
jgi:hypothetical protein